MIRTIISDLGNVLLRFDHMHACRRLAEHCALAPHEIYDSMFSSGLVQEYELGRISSVDFAEGCAKRLGLRLDGEAIREIWSDIFEPVEGMEELMRVLKSSYRLVLLSNTNEWHFEHCSKEYPVVSLFDDCALSFRLGCQKPDPLIYEKAVSMARALPEEIVYFDDIPAYASAAGSLGVRGICFESRTQLMTRLRAEGVMLP